MKSNIFLVLNEELLKLATIYNRYPCKGAYVMNAPNEPTIT